MAAYYQEIDYTSQTMVTLPNIFVPRVQYNCPVRLRRISLRPTGRIGTRTQFFQDRISIPQSQSKRAEIRQNITRKNIITPPE